MTTYINKFWNVSRTRNPEYTNVCFAVAESGTPNLENWEETNETVPANMDQLFMENGVRYYGYL